MTRLAVTLTVDELRAIIREEIAGQARPEPAPAPAPGVYLTPAVAAAELAVHARVLRRWIGAGKLAAIRVGRGLRVERAELDRFAAARRVRPGSGETEAETEAWARKVVHLSRRKG